MGANMGRDQQSGFRASVKIAHVTSVDSTLQYVLLGLLSYLVQQGYRVFGISAFGPSVDILGRHGIGHFQVRIARNFSPAADISALVGLYKNFIREKYDIVHTHTPKANLLGQWAALFARTPIRVMTVHGLYFTPKSKFLRKLLFSIVETLSILPAHAVFLVNSADYNTLKALRLCNMRKVHVLPGGMGIDLQRFNQDTVSRERTTDLRRELGINQGDLVIGFVGRLVREKGILELLDAFDVLRWKFTSSKLLLVGPTDVDKADAITPTLIGKRGFESRCIVTGQRDNMVDLYALMDLLVLPSHREGMPLVVMEAQAMGLPVVTTDARGCVESVLHGTTGIIVPVGNVSALAQAVEVILVSPELKWSFGTNARLLAKERFDMNIAAQTTNRLYQECLSHGNCARTLL